ncbi:MAG: bifunctional oligoribonuclease/PAP phosphatase NrnA [Ruminococcaceae bacterium]|nr:bifunctional oligoribonuclease/PAP phosphatase NrnA [Oscillospiraceae bacterium]
MLKQIAQALLSKDNFAIFPHVNPDGDCLGSALALCSALRNMGKKAYVVTTDPIPQNIAFLWDEGFCAPNGWKPACAVAVDCADPDRMSDKACFDGAPFTCCMDHHGTNPGYGDLSFVEPQAAATGEIIFSLLTDCLGVPLTPFERDCLYTAICTDTGNFKFSNTTPRTHRIAAELIAAGVDVADMSQRLFDTLTLRQLKAHAEAVKNLSVYMDGRVAVTFVSTAFLQENGMGFEDVDFLSSMPRNVEGAEVGIFCKERTPGEIKVSLRSNHCVDVSEIAALFGGGGHKRAAGATISGTRQQAVEQLLAEIAKRV